jgi:hypothetical protein
LAISTFRGSEPDPVKISGSESDRLRILNTGLNVRTFMLTVTGITKNIVSL